jgi:hypothetical protein
MDRRMRILAFGTCAVLVIAGIACAAVVGGVTGQVLTIALISAGLAGAVLLVFLEIGLGEERDRRREQARRDARAGHGARMHRFRRTGGNHRTLD